MRFERKYKVEHLVKAVADQMVKNHPASFRKIYPDRWINNIYYDTPDLKAYKDNVIGTPQRAKFRIRWYGEEPTNIVLPKLEIKAKQNELGTKKLIYFPQFSLQHLAKATRKINELLPDQIPLQPCLMNAYLRSYFGTSDKRFRMTIDSNLKYHGCYGGQRFQHYEVSDEAIIVELKYEGKDGNNADRITQFIPFRQTKSSKYVTGIELTC